MKYTKEDKRKHLILKYRYYDGTEEDVLEKSLKKRKADKDKCLSLQKTKRSSN